MINYKNNKLPNLTKELIKIEKAEKKIIDVDTAYKNAEKHTAMLKQSIQARKNGDEKTADEIRATIKAENDLYAKLCMNNEFEKAVICCLRNNAKIALMSDILPAIIEYLKGINGKQYGEKTADKMREYFRDNYNIGVYLSRHYYTSGISEIAVYLLDDNGFSHGGNYLEIYTRGCDNPIVNANNTITMDNLNSISDFSGRGLIPYIENPREHVKKLIKLKDKARAQLETACNTISDFNKLAPDGVPDLPYISNTIRGYIF